ncbi:MAG: glycosyltransferase family 4 protein [Deltaproteobacteria bacterium]|nr:glycosyltransferase family 4 protein [Deltaproteobacteria bacterium]
MTTLQVNLNVGWRGGTRQTFMLAKHLNSMILCHPKSDFPKKQRGMTFLFDREIQGPRPFPPGHPSWDVVNYQCRCSLDLIIPAIVRVATRRHAFPTHQREREALRKMDGVIAVSNYVKSHLLDNDVPEEKIRVIYPGTDPAWFFEPLPRGWRKPDDEFIIMFCGYLLDIKGLREFMYATKELSHSIPNLLAYVVGDGDLALWAAHYAARHRVPAYFFGHKSEGVYRKLMSRANVFVMPSYEEGLGSIMLDAMAGGLPIVASNVGGIPEIVDSSCGVLVPPAEPKELAQAILKIYENPKLEAQMGHAARVKVSKSFSMERVAKETMAFYKEVLRRVGTG